MPTFCLNIRAKYELSSNPNLKEISLIESSEKYNNRLASVIFSSKINALGLFPHLFLQVEVRSSDEMESLSAYSLVVIFSESVWLIISENCTIILFSGSRH